MKRIDLKQGTEEWLDFRKNKIGASDAPVIMGVSPFLSPLGLWEIKKEIRQPLESNFQMKRGLKMEPEARAAYMAISGNLVGPAMVMHDEYDWMIASLDGLSFDGSVMVEIKCPGAKDHQLAVDGHIPKKYYAQLQHQMAVTGLDSVDYFSYTPTDYQLIRVDRDDEYIEKLLEMEKSFHDLLQGDTPPSMSSKDYVHREDATFVRAADEYLEALSELTIAKEKEKIAREKLIALSDGHSSVIPDKLKLTRSNRKGSIRYKEVEELKGVDLEKYRGPSTEVWTITSS